MSPQSPAQLRILQSVATVLGEDDSLESINTQLVMDRALVTVGANNLIYMLRRDSVATPSGTDIVEPAQGGPGRWFSYPSSSGPTGRASVAGFFATTGLTFPSVPFTANFEPFECSAGVLAGNNIDFVNPANAALQYNGEDTVWVLVTAILSYNIGAGFTGQVAIDLNGDLIALSTSPVSTEVQYKPGVFDNNNWSAPVTRLVQMSTGDIVQPVIIAPGGTSGVALHRMQINAAVLGI